MPSWMKAAELSPAGFIASVVALSVLVLVRRYVPDEARRHKKFPVVLLGVAILLHALSNLLGVAHLAGPRAVLNYIAIFAMAIGITSVAALVVFDVLLQRLGAIKVPPLVRDLIQAVAFVIVMMGSLRNTGVDLYSLVTTSAVLTAVIGLALQSTIANLFAGLALQVDDTVTVDDWIQVGTRVGRITRIKWRSVFLETRDGDTVIVPNSALMGQEVLNFSKPTSKRRIWVRCGFHYKHPPNDVKLALIEAVRGTPGVVDLPSPDCVITGFGDSSVEYAVRYWIDDPLREPETENAVRTRIWYAAQRHGLEIPYPHRVVEMHEITEDRVNRAEAREFQERVDALAQIDLFAPLDGEQKRVLAKEMKRVRFATGEHIINQGDPGDSLFLIHRGQVGVKLAVEGAEREVAMLRDGQFFGEMSLMTGEPRKATCAAKTDVECWLVTHGAFRRVVETKPKIIEDISGILGERQAALAGESESLSHEARTRRAAETSSRLLLRIRDFFHLR